MRKFKKLFRSSLRMKALVFYLAFAMASITSIPSMGKAGTIPTHKSMEATATPAYDREADMALIRTALNSENGKIAMARVGVTQQEMTINISKLSYSQRHLVAEKLRAAMHADSDGAGIIWAVAVIALIIVLVVVILKVLRD